MAREPERPLTADHVTQAGSPYIVLDGWAGLTSQRVEVVGETPKNYRIRALVRTKLAGRDRWIWPGEEALVPKHAIRWIT